MNKKQQVTIDIVKQLVRDAFEEGFEAGRAWANELEYGNPSAAIDRDESWEQSAAKKQFK